MSRESRYTSAWVRIRFPRDSSELMMEQGAIPQHLLSALPLDQRCTFQLLQYTVPPSICLLRRSYEKSSRRYTALRDSVVPDKKYQVYVTPQQSLVVLATASTFYLTTFSKMKGIVGAWSKKPSLKGPEPESRLNTTPYIWDDPSLIEAERLSGKMQRPWPSRSPKTKRKLASWRQKPRRRPDSWRQQCCSDSLSITRVKLQR